jgi:23S rRNA (pseudouridine1915-N3)-methyltransferase
LRVAVFAIGRLKAGPERELCGRYAERLKRGGPTIGLEWAGIREGTESRARDVDARRREEADWLRNALPSGAALVLLDERGRDLSSTDFAGAMGRLRDEGRRDLAFAIGGPDGHDQALRGASELTLSLGRLTWPHQLIRAMLLEQLYRAATILSGHPYHRE